MHWHTPKRVSLPAKALGNHRAKINRHFCLAWWCASHFQATPSRNILRWTELGHPSKHFRGHDTGPRGVLGGNDYPNIMRNGGLAPSAGRLAYVVTIELAQMVPRT